MTLNNPEIIAMSSITNFLHSKAEMSDTKESRSSLLAEYFAIFIRRH